MIGNIHFLVERHASDFLEAKLPVVFRKVAIREALRRHSKSIKYIYTFVKCFCDYARCGRAF